MKSSLCFRISVYKGKVTLWVSSKSKFSCESPLFEENFYLFGKKFYFCQVYRNVNFLEYFGLSSCFRWTQLRELYETGF